jgi:hypothetical protein
MDGCNDTGVTGDLEGYTVTGYEAAGMDLTTYLRQHAPVTPQKAAAFAANVAEQLAAVHAEGRTLGPVHAGVRVELVNGVARPVVAPAPQAGPGEPEAPDDVREVGQLLGHLLLGADATPGQDLRDRPDMAPDPLWSLIAGCLDEDPQARPTAAVLARQLRDTARDLLLGAAPWSVLTELPDATPPGASTGRVKAPVPGFVPGLDSTDELAVLVRPRRRGVRLLAAASIAAVVLAAAGVAFAVSGSADKNPSAADKSPAAADKVPGGQAATAPIASTAPGPNPTTPGPTTEVARPPARSSPTANKPATPAPPAPASTSVACLPPDCAGRVTFQPQDAHLTVCDNKKDGFSAIGIYTRSDVSGEKQLWASNTFGTCADAKLGMRKGAKISFKACIGDHSENKIVACSEPVTSTV